MSEHGTDIAALIVGKAVGIYVAINMEQVVSN